MELELHLGIPSRHGRSEHKQCCTCCTAKPEVAGGSPSCHHDEVRRLAILLPLILSLL